MQESPPQKNRGRRECRVRAAPAVSCASCTRKCAHEHTGSAEAIRHSLRNGFTAYIALSPATNSSCRRHRRINGFVAPGWADENLRRLDTSNGCQDHAVLPYALAPSSCARDIAHGINPPCAIGLTPTLPRPPHPVPTFVTMANAPLLGDETARLIVLICPTGEAEYFFGEVWTGQITLKGFGKLVFWCNGIGAGLNGRSGVAGGRRRVMLITATNRELDALSRNSK